MDLKRTLYQRINNALDPDGLFINTDATCRNRTNALKCNVFEELTWPRTVPTMKRLIGIVNNGPKKINIVRLNLSWIQCPQRCPSCTGFGTWVRLRVGKLEMSRC